MNGNRARLAPALRRTGLGAALVLLLLIAITVSAAAAADAGYLRRPVVGLFSRLLHRQIVVDGPLHCHLLSPHPHLVADQVTVANPPWMPDGVTARFRRVILDLTLPGPSGAFRVDRLELQGATLTLVRNEKGLANWQLQPPRKDDHTPPLVRNVLVRNAQVEFDDHRHHLKFHGFVSALDGRNDVDPWLHINGTGQLNGADMRFAMVCDALSSAAPTRPYRFTFMERSAEAQVSGRGSLKGAFTFNALNSSFDASGANLYDLYLLTGIRLLNTGPFHLTGEVSRAGDMTRFELLQAASGDSDADGTVTIDASGSRPRLTIDLASKLLRLADLGARAAAGDTSPPPSPLLLSTVELKPAVMRHSDALITYRAQRLQAAALTLEHVSARATLEQGVLTVQPFTAALLGGQLQAQLNVDAHQDDPNDNLQLQLHDVQIKGPRFDAALDAHLAIQGHGSSLHQLGASAGGSLSLAIPAGMLRSSLAELAGVDLRGLGLLLSGSRHETPVRCGAATFDAAAGTLTSRDIVLDTDDVQIRGQGTIALGDESLHLAIAGYPKHPRLLRVHAPLSIGGTLRHPAFGLEKPRSVELFARAESQDMNCAALLSADGPRAAPGPDAAGSPPSQ